MMIEIKWTIKEVNKQEKWHCIRTLPRGGMYYNPSLGMYQEIHPFRASSIDSVKINTSLLMRRECSISHPTRRPSNPIQFDHLHPSLTPYFLDMLPGERGVSTILPGEFSGHAGHGVEESPGDDHVVVDHHQERNDQHAVAEALACRGHPVKIFT